MTPSSSAEAGSRGPARRASPRRGAALAAALAWLANVPVAAYAAESTFHYQAGLNETYSQDVFRDGSDEDDYISDLLATLAFLVKTPRSETTFSYSPEYLWYAQFDALNHFDQRYQGSWTVRPGPRSEFVLRQGFSNTTRRVGFQDLAGAGGSASEPVTSFTRQLAWDLEPRWTLKTGPNGSVYAGALYRASRYSDETLVDSDQFEANWGMNGSVGRYQRLGAQVRLDAYQYTLDEGTLGPVYDRFINLQGTWSLKEGEQSNLLVAAGGYRGSGEGLDPVNGPSFDLTGNWRWRRSYLAASIDAGYSTGGGLSTTDRAYQAGAGWTKEWGQGGQLTLGASYIRREPIGETTGPSEPLYGRAAYLSVAKTWLIGLGFRCGVTALRQDQVGTNGLSYGEATLGLTYSPPIPAPKPVPAA